MSKHPCLDQFASHCSSSFSMLEKEISMELKKLLGSQLDKAMKMVEMSLLGHLSAMESNHHPSSMLDKETMMVLEML